MSSDVVPEDWQQIFQWIAIVAVVVVLFTVIFLTRKGRYIGPFFEAIYRRTGWGWTEGRVAHFISDVETIFLELARSDPQRLRKLVGLALACFGLMVLEVWVVFWAIGQPVTVWISTIVETFTRSASVFSGADPGQSRRARSLERRRRPRARAGRRRLARAGPTGARPVLGRPGTVALSARHAAHAAGGRSLMLSAIVEAIQEWASGVGGVGLFVVAALDSSFLSFPQVNDLLIIFLSTKNAAADAVLRRDDDGRLAARVLRAVWLGLARRRGVSAQSASAARASNAAWPSISATACSPSSCLRCCLRRCRSSCSSCWPAPRECRRGSLALRLPSAAASAISARDTWQCCTASRRSRSSGSTDHVSRHRPGGPRGGTRRDVLLQRHAEAPCRRRGQVTQILWLR